MVAHVSVLRTCLGYGVVRPELYRQERHPFSFFYPKLDLNNTESPSIIISFHVLKANNPLDRQFILANSQNHMAQ